MRDFRTAGYLFLRWAALLGGGAVCAGVMLRAASRLPWPELLFLSALSALLRQRVVVMRRAPDGSPSLYHTPGEAVVLIALLRHGPEAALAVRLASTLGCLVLDRRTYFPVTLREASNNLYFPALMYLGGCVYQAFGGHLLTRPADSALFFQNPFAIMLPLLGMLVVVNECIHRVFMGLLLFCKNGEPFLNTLRDPMFSFFDYIENFSGALLLVLWNAFGWGTVPCTLLINEALLLSARAYFERVDAQRDAECDPLTGLASWRGLDAGLRRRFALARGDNASRFAVIFLDVDGLKQVNDQQGHGAGDDLLRLVGEACRQHTRERDLAGRRGGDEFLVILDKADRAMAEAVMARLRQEFLDSVALQPRFANARVGISAGIALYPTDAREPTTLIEAADHQMYRDKQARKTLPLAA